MGVGTYREMAQSDRNWSRFDCVIPTRLARHGAAVQGDRWNLKMLNFGRFYTTGWNLPFTLVSTLAVLIYVIWCDRGNFGLHSVEHSQRYRIDSLHPKDSGCNIERSLYD